MAYREKQSAGERLFIGNFPAGIVYADRSREVAGDYAKCAFLPYDSLELEVDRACPPELRELIERHAASMQEQRGEDYQVSTSGQTVRLGGPGR